MKPAHHFVSEFVLLTSYSSYMFKNWSRAVGLEYFFDLPKVPKFPIIYLSWKWYLGVVDCGSEEERWISREVTELLLWLWWLGIAYRFYICTELYRSHILNNVKFKWLNIYNVWQILAEHKFFACVIFGMFLMIMVTTLPNVILMRSFYIIMVFSPSSMETNFFLGF